MSSTLSMIETSYEILVKNGKGIRFTQLFKQVAKKAKLSEDVMKKKKGQLFSQLMEDPRFTVLEGNVVDLKERYAYDQTHQEYDYDDESIVYDTDISLEDKRILKEEEENSRVGLSSGEEN